jgi:hypothetical protein
MVWIGLIWVRMGSSGGSCEQGNEPSVSIKYCTIGSFSRRAQLHELVRASEFAVVIEWASRQR